MRSEMTTVTYDLGNITKCLCPGCPVQADSSCAMGRLQRMSGMLADLKRIVPGGETIPAMPDASSMSGMPEMSAMSAFPGGLERTLPSAQEMPGMYCSTGQAACDDLDYEQWCVCPTCRVWIDNRLEDTRYCHTGSASQAT